MKKITWPAAILVIALGLAGCGDDNESATAESASSSGETTTTTTTGAPAKPASGPLGEKIVYTTGAQGLAVGPLKLSDFANDADLAKFTEAYGTPDVKTEGLLSGNGQDSRCGDRAGFEKIAWNGKVTLNFYGDPSMVPSLAEFEVRDPEFALDNGVKIGMSYADAAAIYEKQPAVADGPYDLGAGDRQRFAPLSFPAGASTAVLTYFDETGKVTHFTGALAC